MMRIGRSSAVLGDDLRRRLVFVLKSFLRTGNDPVELDLGLLQVLLQNLHFFNHNKR